MTARVTALRKSKPDIFRDGERTEAKERMRAATKSGEKGRCEVFC
jgi:hypothetical protein